MTEGAFPAGNDAPGAPAPGAPVSGRGDRRLRLRWLERSLFLIAALCLGGYVWSTADARFFQAVEERQLERRLAEAGQPAASGPGNPARPAPPAQVEPGESLGRMEIPRLGLEVIVAAGVDNKTLRRAAGHIPGTPLPGAAGNVGIAGHRDSFFRPLKDVAVGDQVVLTMPYGTFLYEVESTQIVGPRQIEVLDPTPEPALTLVTCYPFYFVGSAPKRFIVRAREVSFEAHEGGAPAAARGAG